MGRVRHGEHLHQVRRWRCVRARTKAVGPRRRRHADADGCLGAAEGGAFFRTESCTRFGDLPGKNTAITAFSLESHFPNSAPTIAGWLASKGYSTTNYLKTTVPQIVSWAPDSSPLGVLFWHAHGVPYEDDKGVKQGVMIVTGEYAVAHYSRPIYSEMYKSGELNLGIVKGETVPQYAVTAKFIRQRMHFAPHSIVVLDACFGGDPDIGNAFIAANAGSFVSRDWLSGDHSGTPCLKIFDRLLGTNQEPPISMPKERSFSLDAIRWWLAQNGYDYDPVRYTRTKATRMRSSSGIITRPRRATFCCRP